MRHYPQQKIYCIPQLVVNMEVNTQNKHCCNLKNNRFKMRHAAYSNRCSKAKRQKQRNKMFANKENNRKPTHLNKYIEKE